MSNPHIQKLEDKFKSIAKKLSSLRQNKSIKSAQTEAKELIGKLKKTKDDHWEENRLKAEKKLSELEKMEREKDYKK